MKQASMAIVIAAVLSLLGVVAAQAEPAPQAPVLKLTLQPEAAACSEGVASLDLSQVFTELDECTIFICKDPCRDMCQAVGCRSYCVSLEDCTCDCECS